VTFEVIGFWRIIHEDLVSVHADQVVSKTLRRLYISIFLNFFLFCLDLDVHKLLYKRLLVRITLALKDFLLVLDQLLDGKLLGYVKVWVMWINRPWLNTFVT
jgi:hypothetical protein